MEFVFNSGFLAPGETYLEDAPETLKMLAYELAKVSDESVFMDGVSFCQTILKTWMQDLRADMLCSKEKQVSAMSSRGLVGHYCQFRKAVCNKERSYWRWQDGSGWQQVPASAISSPDFGSRYIVASTLPKDGTGDQDGNGMIELHVCDHRDCSALASSMKSTMERCDAKMMDNGSGSTESSKGSSRSHGLAQLISDDKSSSALSIEQSLLHKCCHPPCVVTDEETEETECSHETIRDSETEEKLSQTTSTKEGTSHGTSSPVSRSGFFSHYAYERTCDMLMSMVSSKQLLPSVVDDETEHLRSQQAGRVQKLVQMYNGMRSG